MLQYLLDLSLSERCSLTSKPEVNDLNRMRPTMTVPMFEIKVGRTVPMRVRKSECNRLVHVIPVTGVPTTKLMVSGMPEVTVSTMPKIAMVATMAATTMITTIIHKTPPVLRVRAT